MNPGTVLVRSGVVGLFGGLRYDPVRREVRFVPDARAFRPSLQYEFVVTSALRAWDGAPLANPVAVRFDPGAPRPVTTPPAPSLARDVAPLLAARCATAGCHAPPSPAMGMDLSSPAAVLRTAVRVASRERPAPSPGAEAPGDPAWSSLLRVDPGVVDRQGRPEYSYVIYKILGDGPVVGRRMPPEGPALTPGEAALVADWIAAGAPAN